MSKLIHLIIAILFFSCSSKSLNPVEYSKWVEDKDNGLLNMVEIEDYQFFLQLKPSEYIVLQQNRDTLLTGEFLKRASEDIKNVLYFNMRIFNIKSKKDFMEDLADLETYSTVADFYNFRAQSKLKLIVDSDTANCILYHFERSYNLAPYNNLVFAFQMNPEFNLKNSEKDIVLVFDEEVLNVGRVNFRFRSNDLNKIPIILL